MHVEHKYFKLNEQKKTFFGGKITSQIFIVDSLVMNCETDVSTSNLRREIGTYLESENNFTSMDFFSLLLNQKKISFFYRR